MTGDEPLMFLTCDGDDECDRDDENERKKGMESPRQVSNLWPPDYKS